MWSCFWFIEISLPKTVYTVSVVVNVGGCNVGRCALISTALNPHMCKIHAHNYDIIKKFKSVCTQLKPSCCIV